MRSMFIGVIIFFFSHTLFADQWVNGYQRKNGTYVNGHYRSDSNSSKADNWSTKGNTNPYTGQKGYKTYDSSPSYNSGYKSKRGY